MRTRSALLVTIVLLLSIAACKKEETKVTVKETLVAHEWKSTAFTANGLPQTTWCWLNSLYAFTGAGNLYFTQGDNLGACGGDPIGTITAVPYKISADEKNIILVSGFASSADTFEIVSITNTQLKTKRVVNKTTPSPDTWEDTFTAQ